VTKLRENVTYSQSGPECPKCGFTFTPDDGTYYQGSYTDEQCPECETKFKVEVYHSTSWTCTVPSDQSK
jgi:rubrerythrin